MRNEDLSSALHGLRGLVKTLLSRNLGRGLYAAGQIRFMPGPVPDDDPSYRRINEGHFLHILLIYLLCTFVLQ